MAFGVVARNARFVNSVNLLRNVTDVAVGIDSAVVAAALASLTDVAVGTEAVVLATGGGNFAWNASLSATSYRIYWGTQSGVYTNNQDVGNVLTFPLANLSPAFVTGTTYFVVVRARRNALESVNSNQIQVLNGVQL